MRHVSARARPTNPALWTTSSGITPIVPRRLRRFPHPTLERRHVPAHDESTRNTGSATRREPVNGDALSGLVTVRSIRLQGAAAVSDQERHRSQLARIDQRPISWDNQRSQRRRVEYGHDDLPAGRGRRPASPTPKVLAARRSRLRWAGAFPGVTRTAPDRALSSSHRIRPSAAERGRAPAQCRAAVVDVTPPASCLWVCREQRRSRTRTSG